MTKVDSVDNASSKDKASSAGPVVEVDLEDEVLRCGYFTWKPDWLQTCNTPRWLLGCICWFTFTQGFIVNGIIYVNLAAWERRYAFTSTQSAWITSAYDVNAAIFTLLFGYIGQFTHNGVILATGALVMSIGSFIMVLPQLLSDAYELGPASVALCDLTGNATDTCLDEGASYYWFFIVAQCFHGVGGAAVYTLAIPYMDDQIKTKNTPVYIGIMQGFAAFGPAMGYICGGLFLNIYVDVLKVDQEIELEPGDPRWVGAWWIGPLYSGLAAITVAALMACFPKELPSARKYKAERQSQAYKGAGEEETQREDFGKSLSDLWLIVKNIFTNPVWVFLTIAGTVESGAIIGFAAFLPKIIQFQFSQPPSAAAIYAGIVVVPGAAGGQVLGGLIPKWLDLKMRGLITQSLLCSIVAIFLSVQFLLRCSTPNIAGVTVNYYYNGTNYMDEPDVTHPCNGACNCTTESYDPVCGRDGIEYFSPCYAGCTDSYEKDDKQVYTECSCIEPASPSLLSSTAAGLGVADSGICLQDCSIFWVFLALFFFMCLSTFVSATSGQAATIRSVPDKQRAFAFGVQRTIVRLLGNVPGPIIFGIVFDKACIIWQQKCDGQGSCWIYDTEFLAEGIFWACVVVKCISSLSFLLALILYKPPPVSAAIESNVTDVKIDDVDYIPHKDGLKQYGVNSKDIVEYDTTMTEKQEKENSHYYNDAFSSEVTSL